MVRERTDMRKIRDVLRLALEVGLSGNFISRAIGLSRASVHEYIRRAHLHNLTWKQVEGLDDSALEEILYPSPVPHVTRQSELDLEAIHKELRKPGVNLRLLWFEYRAETPDGYSYQQFSRLYKVWREKLNLVMRQNHLAGEKLFVDFAGDTIRVTDRETGETHLAQIFLATMGASNYTFAYATPSQELKHWIEANIRALEFLDAVPCLVIPDNLRSAVTTACRFDPVINRTYRRMAEHYGFTIVPARPRRPKDKAKVEKGVQFAETWILARLRDRYFFSFEELNAAIAVVLKEMNAKPFQKLSGNRHSWFETVDKPAMKRLPRARFEFEDWFSCVLGKDYHVMIHGHYYSVDHKLVGRRIDVRTTGTVVEMFFNGKRVASHVRNDNEGQVSTNETHLAPAHRAYAGRTPEYFANEARAVGPATEQIIRLVLASKPYPQLSFDQCFGILKTLKNKHSPAELEAACEYALLIGTASYRGIKDLLSIGVKNLPQQLKLTASTSFQHENIRGPEYFKQ